MPWLICTPAWLRGYLLRNRGMVLGGFRSIDRSSNPALHKQLRRMPPGNGSGVHAAYSRLASVSNTMGAVVRPAALGVHRGVMSHPIALLFLAWLAVGLVVACGGKAVIDGEQDSGSSSASSNGTSSTAAGGPCGVPRGSLCETCVAMACAHEMLDCANVSECDAQGEPAAGCLALVRCMWGTCGLTIFDDINCVSDRCVTELLSAGGVNGEGSLVAHDLGVCAKEACKSECMNGL